MSNLTQQAAPAVATLLNSDEDQLYAELGIRARAIATDPTVGAQFSPEVTYHEAEMGVLDDVKEFGQRLFRRWNVEAHKLCCGGDPADAKDRAELMEAFGISDAAAAAVISGVLVSSMGVAPAIAVVIAALVVKRFFRPAHQEFCEVWKKNLPADT